MSDIYTKPINYGDEHSAIVTELPLTSADTAGIGRGVLVSPATSAHFDSDLGFLAGDGRQIRWLTTNSTGLLGDGAGLAAGGRMLDNTGWTIQLELESAVLRQVADLGTVTPWFLSMAGSVSNRPRFLEGGGVQTTNRALELATTFRVNANGSLSLSRLNDCTNVGEFTKLTVAYRRGGSRIWVDDAPMYEVKYSTSHLSVNQFQDLRIGGNNSAGESFPGRIRHLQVIRGAPTFPKHHAKGQIIIVGSSQEQGQNWASGGTGFYNTSAAQDGGFGAVTCGDSNMLAVICRNLARRGVHVEPRTCAEGGAGYAPTFTIKILEQFDGSNTFQWDYKRPNVVVFGIGNDTRGTLGLNISELQVGGSSDVAMRDLVTTAADSGHVKYIFFALVPSFKLFEINNGVDPSESDLRQLTWHNTCRDARDYFANLYPDIHFGITDWASCLGINGNMFDPDPQYFGATGLHANLRGGAQWGNVFAADLYAAP